MGLICVSLFLPKQELLVNKRAIFPLQSTPFQKGLGALNPLVVCSTERSKAVVSVLVLLLVALWFILRGDLLYVFPCVILFLCFSVLLVLRLPRLGKRELILMLFVRLFGLCLFRFVGFLFLLGSGKSCGLWLWHSLDFSLTFFGIHESKQEDRNLVSLRRTTAEILPDIFTALKWCL